ncbi:MAG: type II secretion system protein [Polyangiaceae bacterium]
MTPAPAPHAVRGFTLLEVLVAIAILGLGLTMILSSQVGLFSSASRGEHLTVATNLARCKMGEIEVDLLKKGYPATDSKDDGRCCGDDTESGGYECEWKIERVTLPDQAVDAGGMDASLGPLGALANMGAMGSTGAPGATGAGANPMGMLGALSGLGAANGLPAPSASAGPTTLQGITESMNASSAGAGLGPMVMGLVYPGLKPLLEASIRKVTLRVKWKEGVRERDVVITQYVTDPQKAALTDGGLLPGMTAPGVGSSTAPTQTSPSTSPLGAGVGVGVGSQR